MFFKELSVDAKIDYLLASHKGLDRGNITVSNANVHLVAYLWKGLFQMKILLEVVLSCDDY